MYSINFTRSCNLQGRGQPCQRLLSQALGLPASSILYRSHVLGKVKGGFVHFNAASSSTGMGQYTLSRPYHHHAVTDILQYYQSM